MRAILPPQLKRALSMLGGPYLALVVLVLVCALSSDVFIRPANLLNILRQVSYSGIIALGMTFVIAGGGIDLSVGSLFALCGVCSVIAANDFTPVVIRFLGCGSDCGDTLGFLIALGISLGVGALGAAVNGAVIVFGKIPPFIATLGTYSIFRSLALYLADSGTLVTDNETIAEMGEAELSGLPLPSLILVILTILLGIFLASTSFGRHVCAVGANERVAKFAGIRTGLTKFFTYLIIGGCIGVSSMLFVGRLGSISSSNAGMLYELDAIAAVIIGGAPMSGGRGSLRGTLAGILILGIVSNILDMWGVSVNLQGLVKGLVIIISVLIQRKEKLA